MLPLTIITINYNDCFGLKRTLRSVQNQHWGDFEHLVIDGNSTDGSSALLQNTTYKQLTWLSEPDTGIYNAMNKGIGMAKGIYVLFLNAGDELENDGVLEKVNHLLSTEKDFYYGHLVFRDDTGDRTNVYESPITFQYLSKYGLGHPACFIKKELFEIIGLYNENLKISSDWEFFLKAIFIHNISYTYLNFPIAIFYQDGISSDPSNASVIATERQHVLDTYFGAFREDFRKLNNLSRIYTTAGLRGDSSYDLVWINKRTSSVLKWVMTILNKYLHLKIKISKKGA